jgi:hypothetical protein
VAAGLSIEDRASALVAIRSRVAGGPYFIELVDLVNPPVAIGPYENPAVAREDAKHVKQFLIALIRAERSGT